MCFDRFLLAFESRDLSQADKRITRVFFPKLQFLNDKLQLYPKKLFGNLAKLFILSLKSLQVFSVFFLVRGKSERIEKIYFAESSGLRPERQKNKFHYSSFSLGKKTLLKYFCQLEIDHVTQKPKETCQSTCSGPWSTTQLLSNVMKIKMGNRVHNGAISIT
jgi:hypothetical protein